MGISKISSIELVTEMAQSDSYATESVNIEYNAELIMEELVDIDELDAPLLYTESMIPVFKNGDDYLIEHDNVVKLMATYEAQGVIKEELELVTLICRENDIDMNESDVYLVIESDETYRRNTFFLTEKLKKEKDPKKKNLIRLKLGRMKMRFNKLKNSNKLKTLKKKTVSKTKSKPKAK